MFNRCPGRFFAATWTPPRTTALTRRPPCAFPRRCTKGRQMQWCLVDLPPPAMLQSTWMMFVRGNLDFCGLLFFQLSLNHVSLHFFKFHLSTAQCWEEKNPPRDPVTHELVGDHKRFPSGMGALGSYVRGKGLGFAMYTAESTETCGGYPASANYEDLDAKTFAKCEYFTPRHTSWTYILTPFARCALPTPYTSSLYFVPYSLFFFFTLR